MSGIQRELMNELAAIKIDWSIDSINKFTSYSILLCVRVQRPKQASTAIHYSLARLLISSLRVIRSFTPIVTRLQLYRAREKKGYLINERERARERESKKEELSSRFMVLWNRCARCVGVLSRNNHPINLSQKARTNSNKSSDLIASGHDEGSEALSKNWPG